uniref:F-box domain-containing protein n=1 Tax=Trichobilharzia regenti TaxID=157069 RepID=A0AA85KBU1_TRIRE|nr:unnamed protein product [Trichobilharzia regenti]
MNQGSLTQDSTDEEYETSISVNILETEVHPLQQLCSRIKFSLPPSNEYVTASDTYIHKLPFDILIEIFKYLPASDLLRNIPAVCQLWYNASHVPTLRTSLSLRSQIPSELILRAILSRPMLRVLRCLALQHAEYVLADAIKFCRMLTCLDIGFTALSERETVILAQNLPPTLLHLNVEGLRTIEINFISTLVLKCPKLEALNLSHCVSVCDSCIKIISEQLHNLCRLNLDGVQWITNTGILYLTDSEAIHTGKLTDIWLDGFELSNSGLNEFIIRLGNTTQRLLDFINTLYPECDYHRFLGIQQLWISFCDNIEDTTIMSIANLSNLTSLTLRNTQQVTPNALSSLFVCQTANNLNRKFILKYLEYLDLSEAPGVNDTVVLDMCSCCGNRLHTLILNWCWEITDIGINEIIHVCCCLHQLSLIGNSTIHGTALSDIPVKVPNLVILNLIKCGRISDNILETLAFKMPNLYVFDYFGERVGGGLNDVCHYDSSSVLVKVPICSCSL